MSDLSLISRIPNVTGAVLGDVAGAFHDAIREADGEAIAAVTGFIATSFRDAAEQLGLGALTRASVAGGSRASVLLFRGEAVITVTVAPPAALPNVERALDNLHAARG